MREGAYKLLRASSKREPMLSASKNLLTCNARIKAYMGHMQETKDKRNLTAELSRYRMQLASPSSSSSHLLMPGIIWGWPLAPTFLWWLEFGCEARQK